jgi:putative redox protein
LPETVEINWVREELFAARDRYGNSIVVGSTPRSEPQFRGVKPSDLLLISLMACSAHDLVNILRKQRQELLKLRVIAVSVQSDRPPFAFEKIHLQYRLAGTGLRADQVRRAITLSETRYCSVYNTLRHAVELSSDFEIEDA